MVEFYHAKKRRGIASLRTSRVDETKPYWPGLEIDEHDRERFSYGSHNISDNMNTKAVDLRTESETKTVDKRGDNTRIDSNEETQPPHIKNLRTFRTRKRKQNYIINNNKTRKNCLPQSLDRKSMATEEQEVGFNGSNAPSKDATSDTVGTTNRAMETCVDAIATRGKVFGTKSPRSLAEVAGSNHTTTARTTISTQNITPVFDRNNSNESTDDLSSVASGGAKPTGTTTPRALVGLLLQKKFPVLEEVVSDIRNVLFGMVSRSPVLRQKHLARATAPLPLSPDGNNLNNKKIDDENIYPGSQNGMDHCNVSRWERKHPPHEERLSKLQDICKRQENLLDRIDGLESAALRREEEFRKQTQSLKQMQQLQQLEEEHRCQRQKDFIEKLQRDYHALQKANASLKTELERTNNCSEFLRLELQTKDETIKDLEESKRSIHYMFQSRFDEQFRELSERDCVIENQRKLLENARVENEKLQNRIIVLEGHRTVSSNANVCVNTTANDCLP